MKKTLFAVTASLTILPMLAFAQVGDVNPNPTSNCVSITHNLQYRSRDAQTGGDVSTLQDFLQSQGYLNSEPTGYFGLLTQSAAKAFQSAGGILNSGYVGPITRAKINSVSCGGTIVKPVTPATSVVKPTPTSPTPVAPVVQPTPITPVPTQPAPQPVTPPSSTTSTTAATITLTSPNGGEVWNPGETHDITWTSSDTSDYKYVIILIQGIPTSVNGVYAPSGYRDVVRSILNSAGKYSWTIPSDISTLSGKERAKIQIIAISASGKSNIMDLTDGFFSISGAKTLSCTDTDGGKNYNTKGLIVDNTTTTGGGKWDRCGDDTQVWEFSCQNSVAVGEYHTCPNGCFDGACRP